TRSRECLTQAMALDEQWAAPHVELGGVFVFLAVVGMMSAHDAMPLARGESRKALALEPSQPEGLELLGRGAALSEYDWKEARRLINQAVAHEPVSPDMRMNYGLFLVTVGRSEQGIEEIERAVSLDPLNPRFKTALIVALLTGRRFSASASLSRRILEHDETVGFAWYFLSKSVLLQGDIAEATTAAERAFALMPWNPEFQAHHAGLLGRRGDEGPAQRLLQRLGDGHAYGAPGALLHYYLARQDIEQSAHWAAKAIE